MFHYDDTDFCKMAEFALKWRWTSAKHNKLPLDELAKIQPFTEDTANILWQYSKRMQGKNYQEKYQEVDEFHVPGRNDAKAVDVTRIWLQEKIGGTTQPLLISWIESWAALTTIEIFIKYWDDFCYPVEDNVIWPQDESWALLFDYKQRFYFAERL